MEARESKRADRNKRGDFQTGRPAFYQYDKKNNSDVHYNDRAGDRGWHPDVRVHQVGVVKQLDFICTLCPIADNCDEMSLYCSLAFITKPNAVQRRAMRDHKAEVAAEIHEARRQYWRDRYRRQKEQTA